MTLAHQIRLACCWFAALSVAGLDHVTAAESVILRVSAGQHDRRQTPVFAPVPKELTGSGTLTLTRLPDGQMIPSQRIEVPVRQRGTDVREQIAWIVERQIDAGQHRDYRLTRSTAGNSAVSSLVTVQDDDGRLIVSAEDKPVLHYNHREVESPAGIDPIYQRSGHIYPLFNPAGQAVTDDFPPDHAHQHSVFFPWVRTRFDGRKLDFWNQAGKTARIQHDRFTGKPRSGPVFAEFRANLRHVDISTPAKPMDVLHESWTVRVYNISEFFLIDFVSRQQCATAKPLTIEKYHYGGMAVRGSRQWFEDETEDTINRLRREGSPASLSRISPPRDYLTSEGKTWIDGNQTRARWVDMHGDIDGRPTGFSVMCHPANFRAPQPVRLHPSKPYFCFAPMALGDFEIKPGETYISRYRFFVHNGGPVATESDRLWNDYAFPPSVTSLASDE